jgi:hypothetical protein
MQLADLMHRFYLLNMESPLNQPFSSFFAFDPGHGKVAYLKMLVLFIRPILITLKLKLPSWSHLEELAEHYDYRDFIIENHRPELSLCIWQRSLAGNKAVILAKYTL